MYLALSRHDYRRSLLAPYVYWAERSACSASKLVITISEKDRRQFAKWIPSERIEVIPQGFDPLVANPFYEFSADAQPVVLFVGSFHSKNNRLAGERIAKKILPEVVKTRPDVKFQMIGANPPSDFRAPNLECLGFVDDLTPHLRRANLVIAPMPFGQGMSSKIVLALAFGKAIVATPEAAAGLEKKYRTLRVTPLEHFSRKVLELLAQRPGIDPGQFQALCDEFAWPNLIERLYSRIEECCAAPQPAQNKQPGSYGATPWR
jgi:glycosyltransferase involved in cell wall biosynthesis